MAFSISIPGIVRLTLVSSPEEILAVNEASMVSRSLSGRGGLFNRAIADKLAVFRSPDGDVWPAFRDRADMLRATDQASLESKLSDTAPLLQRIAPQIMELGQYVRTGSAPRTVGVAVQHAIGRLFFDSYTASEESYKAALTLQSWISAGPLRSFLLKRSGELQKALDRITSLSRGNMACAHATTFAIDNIIKSIESMRKLSYDSENAAKLNLADVLRDTFHAPARVVREARDGGKAGVVSLRSRSLVIFAVDKAHRKSPDPNFAFFSKAWNRCPAYGFIPAFLAEVWRAAATTH